MKIQKKPALIALAAVAALLLFLGFGLGPLVRSIAIAKLEEKLKRPVSLGDVTFNPFSLTFRVNALSIGEVGGKGEFAGFNSLEAVIGLSSLYRLAPVVKEFSLDNPRVNVVRYDDGSYNFSDLAKGDEAKPAAGEGAGKEPSKFFVGNINVRGGAFTFDNKPRATAHRVTEFDLFVPVVSNLTVYIEKFAEPRLSFDFDGSRVTLKGETKPFADSLETRFAFKADGVNLIHYLAYSPVDLGFAPKSAELSADLQAVYVQHREKEPELTLEGSLAVQKIDLQTKEGDALFSAGAVKAAFAPSNLLAGRVLIEDFSVSEPYVNVIREKSGEINLAVLGKTTPKGGKVEEVPKPAEEGGASGASAPFELEVKKASFGPGTVSFQDRAAFAPYATKLENFQLTAEEFSLAPKTLKKAALSFQAPGVELVSVEAGGVLSPVSVAGSFKVQGVSLPGLSPYYREKINFDVVSGLAGVEGGFTHGAGKTTVKNGSFDLRALKLKKEGEPSNFLTLNSLEVKGAEADTESRTARVGEVKADGLAVNAALMPDKTFSLSQLTPEGEAGAPKADEGGEAGWGWQLDSFALSNSAVNFEDRTRSPLFAYGLSKISARVSNLSNGKDKKAGLNLSLGVGAGGQLKADGPFGINPLEGELKLGLNGVDLRPFAGYFGDYVNAVLVDGTLNLKGAASFKKPEGLPAQSGFMGDVEVTSLKLLDGENAEDLLKVGALALNGMAVSTEPMKVAIQGISITDPYVLLEVAEDGTVNMAKLSKKVAGAAAEPKAEEKPVAKEESAAKDRLVEINAVALQGGVVDFTDRHIKPNYRMKLVSLSGRVARMSSLEETGGDVSVFGSIDNYAPMEITGKVNPFAKNFLVDLKIDFKNVELSPFTPYSSRFLGYKIQKGKLGMALKYNILGKKLDSENKVVIDQLTLGEPVESPDAVGIPVRFALALITDRNGVIDLDVPVAGTLDDPDFSYGRIIWKIIVNLLVKAVTSPFALLGSLFGGGEDLSIAVFAPGEDLLTPDTSSRLDKLVKALEERKALNLEVSGYADPEADRETLREKAYARKLKAAKLKELIKAGSAPVELDAITIEAEERPAIIGKAFEEDKIPKPQAGSRPLTLPEMEKLLITYTVVGEEELKALAGRRARNVIDYLVSRGKVDPARVFLLEAAKLAPEPKEGAPLSRVEFLLK